MCSVAGETPKSGIEFFAVSWQCRKMSRWESLVAAFELEYLEGMQPWDANKLEKSFAAKSHGEKCVIQFLLNLWDRGTEWSCGPFDVLEAFGVWDDIRRNAFLSWANNRFWP